MCIVKMRSIEFLRGIKLHFDTPSCGVVKLITFLDILGYFLYFCMKVNVSGGCNVPFPVFFGAFAFMY